MEVEQKKTETNDNEDAFERIKELEAEKKRMQDEFNMQRAKLKELFLQKEDELNKKTQENLLLLEENQQVKHELDDVKSQLVVAGMALENDFEQEKRKANEEIASLQQLVHETVEESSSTRIRYDRELQNLQNYIQQLQNEILALKNAKKLNPPTSSQESSLAASVVLNAFTKGIVKKLGAETFTTSQDEEKNKIETNNHGYEDAEVLRSLIGPLEDQIQALKEKLRSTDEQLQKCKECGHSNNQIKDLDLEQNVNSINSTIAQCDMCTNYEQELVKEQQLTKELEKKVEKAEKAAERHKEELLKEIGFRKDMEEKWNEKKEEHKKQVAELTVRTQCAEAELKELSDFFYQTRQEMLKTLEQLRHGREETQQELIRLQNENDKLIGRYTAHSQELENEAINLPNTVEELHELILKHHQDLIIAKIGKEAAEDKVQNLQYDIIVLKDQIANDQHEKESLENNLVEEIKVLKQQRHQLEKEKRVYLANQEKLANSEKENAIKINELHKKLEEQRSYRKKLEEQISELKNRVSALQRELETSETVQKDFVKLSQSLQVQLEKIRESDTQVRWQHEEDVSECPRCHCPFAEKNKHKIHCRHCGQIFCQNCLPHVVESGASMRPSKVCEVCHTLLVKSSAPYFSEAPPPMT